MRSVRQRIPSLLLRQQPRLPLHTPLRHLILRPDGTKDPGRYPLGFVPLFGSESIDFLYDTVKEGHCICSQTTIEVIHNACSGIDKLLNIEYPCNTFAEVVALQHRRAEVLNRILISRAFWEHADFNDPVLNSSFGVQNNYFDNYKWSQVLWKEFRLFAERYFPISDHTHLPYRDYTKLIEAFYLFKEGTSMKPLLPRGHRLKPAFGTAAPNAAMKGPILMYLTWLRHSRAAFAIHKCLIVRGGCGVAALATRSAGVPMVRMTDPNPFSIKNAKEDAERLGFRYKDISFVTSEMFPPSTAKGNKYKMILYCPDQTLLQGLYSDSLDESFAPGLQGFEGNLEQFFEQAGDFLSEDGLIVIACSNFYGLAQPDKPNPIEYEVKVNRRWVILDYLDKSSPDQTFQAGNHNVRLLKEMRTKLRSELWVLHKVSALQTYGYLHGIPGAALPANAVGKWKNRSTLAVRRRVMRSQVELAGGDWGEYKDRMLRSLQENTGEEEDDEAEAVRMALDPSYPMELAERAKRAVASNMEEREGFHSEVAAVFGDVSPRAVFDTWAAKKMTGK